MSYRIGIGYDVHRLEENRKLILGGVEIPHTKGCIAHSDGDVLIHAICDALLGSISLGDIGSHFPDTDPEYRNADSSSLLASVLSMLHEKGYRIGNIDTVVCLQKPKINRFIPEIRQKLADITGMPASGISVKATTTERLGFVGEEKGISASAVVIVSPLNKRSTG